MSFANLDLELILTKHPDRHDSLQFAAVGGRYDQPLPFAHALWARRFGRMQLRPWLGWR